MAMCRCIDVGIVSYVVRCVSDNLVSHVSNFDNKLSIGFVSIEVSR